MTITKAKPTLWQAAIERELPNVYRWAGLVRDVSGEFNVGYGEKLSLTKITSGVTVRDYTPNTDIADPERMTDAAEVLTVDQYKYFNIAVDDIDAAQSRPALLSYFAQQAASSMGAVVDTFLRGVFEAGVPSGQQEAVEVAKYGTPDSSAVAVADLTALVMRFNDVVEALEARGWPLSRAFCVINTRIASLLRLANIRTDANVGGSGSRADSSFVDGGITNLLGVRTIVDPNMNTATAAAGDVVANFGLIEGVAWARQIGSVETYRPERQFGDAVKGLMAYGAEKVHGDRQFQIVYS